MQTGLSEAEVQKRRGISGWNELEACAPLTFRR